MTAEQADAERLAELNRNKDDYEGRTHAQAERNSGEEYAEQQRQSALRKQRDDEVEASAQRIAEGRERYREEQAHKEAQERKEARRKEFKETRSEVNANPASRPATHEEQIERSRFKLEEKRREQEIRSGHAYHTDDHGKTEDWGFSSLSPTEKGIVKDEVERSASVLKTKREEWIAKGRPSPAKDTYFKTAPTGSQVKDMLLGKKPWAEEKKTKEVKPITTFLGGQKYKAEQRLVAAKENFIAELKRPAAGIQAGRQKRAEQAMKIEDPFKGLTQSQQQARVRRHRPREGTGMLFSEGFFNPPARATPPKKGKAGRKPRTTRKGLLDFDFDNMIL
jgi:hypothetical protein